MSDTTGNEVRDAATKVVVLASADREAAAHCRVLLGALRDLGRDAVIVMERHTGTGGLDAEGVSIIDLGCAPRWGDPLAKAAEARTLARIVDAERPAVLHVIGLKPAALACLALRLARVESVVVHLPDLEALGSGGFSWPYRKFAVKLLASQLSKPNAFLLVEREEDLSELRKRGIDPGPRFAVVGGAGVDPDVFPVLPPSQSEMPIAAFVGPVDEPSGVRELLQAFERLWARGLRLQLEVHGEPDTDAGHKADTWPEERARWSLHPGVHCHGWPDDTREIWRRAEICVWPAHARQGLPRPLLEAAACGRALIATDAAGARTFVRDEVEGLIVPARDVQALGAALERLARDTSLRLRMGAAARLRVLQGFTEAHVKEALRGAYLSLTGARAAVAAGLDPST